MMPQNSAEHMESAVDSSTTADFTDYSLDSLGQEDTANSEKPPSKRARVEEVEDEDAPGQQQRCVKDYPWPAGTPIVERGRVQTAFEKIHSQKNMAGEAPWAPFASEEEWELAEWLMNAGISQKQMDRFLKLPIVCV